MGARPEVELAALLRETRRLVRRNRRRLDPLLRAEIAALQGEAKSALQSGNPERIDRALQALSRTGARHLEPLRRSILFDVALTLIVAVGLAIAFRLLAFEAYRIPSGSMVPTLLPGDVVLVSKGAYGLRLPGGIELTEAGTPSRGDVIVFEDPRQAGSVLIKRVVGLPGETIELLDGVVHVDGQPQERRLVQEHWQFWNHAPALAHWHPQTARLYREDLDARQHGTVASPLLPSERQREGPFEIPAGHVFVLGDNRDESEDGRSDGGWYVPLASIRGRADRILLSWGPDGSPDLGRGGPRLERIFAQVDGSADFLRPPAVTGEDAPHVQESAANEGR